MSKHTPGPWINDGDEISGLADGENSQSYIVPICTMDADWNAEITAANARLIAAAPDLLDALQKMLVLYQGRKQGVFGEWTEPVIDARAAIKKATGGKP